MSATLGRRPIFTDAAAAQVVVDALNSIRGEKAYVIAFVVMPDHLHALLVPKEPLTISEVMRSLKGSAAREINRLHDTSG